MNQKYCTRVLPCSDYNFVLKHIAKEWVDIENRFLTISCYEAVTAEFYLTTSAPGTEEAAIST